MPHNQSTTATLPPLFPHLPNSSPPFEWGSGGITPGKIIGSEMLVYVFGHKNTFMNQVFDCKFQLLNFK